MFKQYQNLLLALILGLSCITAQAKSKDCLIPQEVPGISKGAQSLVDEIYFNAQVMQGEVGIKEVSQRASFKQGDEFQKGTSSNFLFFPSNIKAHNYLSFYEAVAPEYFIPSTSSIRNIASNGSKLSIMQMEQALQLGKCQTSEDWFIGDDQATYYFNYHIPSKNISTPAVGITITVFPPKDFDYVKDGYKLSKKLEDNIWMINVDRAGYDQYKIPALRTGQAATRQGLWKADLSKAQIEQANQSNEVFLQVGESIPSLGLSEKDEKKIKWTWIDNGVEFLKAQKKGAF